MSVSAEKQTHLSGHKWHISELEFSPGGLHLASSSWDKTLRIWDLSTLESVFVLRHHRSPVTCLSWQPGVGTAGCLGVLASGSADSTVALWSGETGKLLQSLSPHKGWVLGISFSSDGTLLACCLGQNCLSIRCAYGTNVAETDGAFNWCMDLCLPDEHRCGSTLFRRGWWLFKDLGHANSKLSDEFGRRTRR